MYFKTLSPWLFKLRQWFEVRFFSVVICKCCKFSTSLLVWMEIQGVYWTTINNLTLSIYLFLGNFLKTELKKNSVDLRYWNNQHSGPCKNKRSLQVVKPYSFNVAKKRLPIFYYEKKKMKFLSSLVLKNFSSHLAWKLSWTPFHKWSPLLQWTSTRLNFQPGA